MNVHSVESRIKLVTKQPTEKQAETTTEKFLLIVIYIVKLDIYSPKTKQPKATSLNHHHHNII